MSQYWLATFSEFIGTALLILLGNGVCAAVSYKRMGANQAGKFVCIILGWGLAVFLAALVSTSMGGVGHLNPAVTIMDAIKAGGMSETDLSSTLYGAAMKEMEWTKEAAIAVTFVLFTILQFVGAMFGQVVSNFINFKFITDKENDLLTIRGCHATAPAYENKKDKATIFNFAYEFIGTLVLVGLIVAFGSGDKNPIDKSNGALGTIPVAFLIMSIGLSLGSATGYAINPVRDFGPRMVFVLFAKIFRKDEFNKGMINWEYSWVPVVAPMLAGAIVGLITLIQIA